MMKKLLCILLFAVFTVGVVQAQSISVTGLGQPINNGDTTTSTGNNTSFPSVDINTGGTISNTFVLTNTSPTNSTLLVAFNTITNITPNTPGDGGFSNGSIQQPVVVQPGQTRNFTIDFDPSVVGLNEADVSLDVNILGGGSETFVFRVDGIGTEVLAPDIEVVGNGQIIISQDTNNTPSVSNGTDFGDVNEGSFLDRVFTINNVGNDDLLLNGAVTVLISGGDGDFTVINQPATTLTPSGTPGSTTTFTIRFEPSSSDSNPIEATVLIENNDPDIVEQFFLFDLTGNGLAPEPEIDVQGQGNSIPGNGSNTPIADDNTNFGSSPVGSPEVRTFTILNTGNDDLNLTGTPSVIISGGDGDFVVTQQPAITTIGGPTGSTTFEITFTPSSSDSNPIQATVLIENDDSDETFYLFNIEGNGEPNEPEIDISYSGGNITSGGTIDFGSANVSSGFNEITFTITNSGTQDLDLDGTPIIDVTGANLGDFIIQTLPSTPITPSNNTTFIIRFDPSALGTRSAQLSIDNNDTDENPFLINLTGEGVDSNAGAPLMITQYYEGISGDNNWIEVKNVSETATCDGCYFLAQFTDSNGTINGNIETRSPDQSIEIPVLQPGDVAIFRRSASTNLPSAGNLGTPDVPVEDTEVCNFDGNDIIVISTTNDENTYNSRIDVLGTVAVDSPVDWGQDISLIKGCGTTESPSSVYDPTNNDYDPNQFITLTLDEVNNANPSSNIAIGTQAIGTATYTTSWSDNVLPDKTRNVLISGTYNASSGSFEACNLTVSGNLNMDSNTTNYVNVHEDLSISGTFTVGDTEALLTDGNSNISGVITKIELSTTLNNYRDFTYWSSPVQGATINGVFVNPPNGLSGVDPNRIFEFRTPSTGGFIGWDVANGSMTRGRGYISEAPNDGSNRHELNFIGTPNTGTVNVAVGIDQSFAGGYGFNLVGNPYPSAINIDNFILSAANIELDENPGTSIIDGTIWLWTHNTQISNGTSGVFSANDYATYNLTGGVGNGTSEPSDPGGPPPTSNIGSSQGFFVNITSPGDGEVRFTNQMRITDGQNDQFFRNNDSKKSTTNNIVKDRIWLNVNSKEGGASNQLLIGFFENATDGFDRGYDGLKFSGGNYISFYSLLDGDRYAIQALGAYSSDKKVTLGFNTSIEQTFTISIHNVEGVLENEEIYLVDNELGIVHDLKAGGYEFEITETGNYSNRFTLQFNKSVLSVGDESLDTSFLVINEDNGLRLRSNTAFSDVKVYDMLGRKLIDAQPNVNDFVLEAGHIAKGTVLIINATLENGAEVSKKALKY